MTVSFAVLFRRISGPAFFVLMAFSNAGASELVAVAGEVQLERGGHSYQAVTGTVVLEADTLTAASGAQALMAFDDGGRMLLRQNSRVTLDELKLAGPPTMRQKTVRLIKGSMRYVSGRSTARDRVRFQTRSVSVGIRGTDIEMALSEEDTSSGAAGTYLKVNAGVAVLDGLDGSSVEVAAGQIAVGGEPALVTRGLGQPRPSARLLDAEPAGLFQGGDLDAMMR